MTYRFYTPDLAMENVIVDDLLLVIRKEYDPDKDMMYWEFERAWTIKD